LKRTATKKELMAIICEQAREVQSLEARIDRLNDRNEQYCPQCGHKVREKQRENKT